VSFDAAVKSGTAPLVAIVGPSGSGKSELALRMAEVWPAEIVNCDSLQIYRHFDIGTAKLGEGERAGVPHHLIDVAEPDELFTAGDYARRARPLLREIVQRGRLPLVVGGTGFYLRALLEGLFVGPERDESLRERLKEREARRPGSLHRVLSRLDARSAERIHPRDVNKLIRALEVCLVTQRPLSALHAEGREPLRGFRPLKIGLNPPREALHARLDARCRRMFAGGLLEETERILAMGYSPASKPFESLGYSQALRHLKGKLGLEEAVALTQRDTRRYAKRQMTWFRREADIEWFEGFGDEPAAQAWARRQIEEYLEPPANF